MCASLVQAEKQLHRQEAEGCTLPVSVAPVDAPAVRSLEAAAGSAAWPWWLVLRNE